jgi:hypothetical protein
MVLRHAARSRILRWCCGTASASRRHGRGTGAMVGAPSLPSDAVWCPFRRPSMYRPVHCELLRSEVLDLTTIVPATPCHHRSYAMPCGKSMEME